MKRIVLMIGPQYMDIYKDIIMGLQLLGYEVDFAPELRSNKDHLNVRRPWCYFSCRNERVKQKYWYIMLNKKEYSKKYDILFVLNGQGLHHILFDVLRKRNPAIKCYNYLFDTIKGVYRFNAFFPYFDKVFSFDRGECDAYGLNWLPIYWVPQDNTFDVKYDIFGFGAYSSDRFKIYKELYDFSKANSLRSFIKLYCIIHREWLYPVLRMIGTPFGLKFELSLEDYHSPLIAKEIIPPTEYRKLINESKIVIDTHPEHQDGMTARFMWAIGAGKKVITTNSSIVKYDFYSQNLIYVLKNSLNHEEEKKLLAFIYKKTELDRSVLREIEKYRIDNWLQTIVK